MIQTHTRAWAGIWLAGSLGSLAFYGFRALHFPRITAVGVERLLFPVGTRTLSMPASQDGRAWVSGAGNPSAAGMPTIAMSLLDNVGWPPRALNRFRRPPLEFEGTWRLEGDVLRHVWQISADGCPDRHHLTSGIQLANESGRMLDLRTGRTFVVRSGTPLWQALKPTAPGITDEDEGSYLSASTGHDELPGMDDHVALDETGSSRFQLGDERVYLQLRAAVGGQPTLVARSDAEAPVSLPLTPRGVPMALSSDGRTVYFQRAGALWRLDLKKPLPELLKEAVPPPLPEPSN